MKTLPPELKYEVLKHHFLSSWAMKITTQKQYGNFAQSESSSEWPILPSNHALLVYLSVTVQAERRTESGVPIIGRGTNEVGWVIIPLYTEGMEVSANSCDRALRGVDERAQFFWRPIQQISTIADASHASHAWNAFRPSSILASITYTKTVYKLLKK